MPSAAGTLGCVPTLRAPLQLPVTCFSPPGFQIKSQQSEVTRILDGKNIKYELVDISQDNALREEMRAKAGNPKAIPPQIVNGDHYCGVRLVLCTGDKHHGGWVAGNNPVPLFLLQMMSRRLSKGISREMRRQSAARVKRAFGARWLAKNGTRAGGLWVTVGSGAVLASPCPPPHD